MNLNLSLRPDYIASVLGIQITNTLLTSLLVSLFLIAVIVIFHLKPRSALSRLIRVIVYNIYQFTNNFTEDAKLTEQIFPLVATLFIFIGACNLLALLPGFIGSFKITSLTGTALPLLRSPNSSLTTTLALTFIAMVSIESISVRDLGLGGSLKRFFNFDHAASFIIGIFELMSEVVRILSYSFRLFGNVLAGEIMLVLISSFFPWALPLPFMFLELFVGILQAFIFYALTISYIKHALADKTLTPKPPALSVNNNK